MTELAQELAEEKTVKKVATLNLVGDLKRMVTFHHTLQQEAEAPLG